MRAEGGITTFTTLAICMCARFLPLGRLVVEVPIRAGLIFTSNLTGNRQIHVNINYLPSCLKKCSALQYIGLETNELLREPYFTLVRKTLVG